MNVLLPLMLVASLAAAGETYPPPSDLPVHSGLPAPMIEVPRWEMHEFEWHGRCLEENPFRDATVVGEFTAPSGIALRIEGFHDGGDTRRLRFTPTEEGEWRYRLRGEGVAITQEGRLLCVASRTRGLIRVHPENPYAFAYAAFNNVFLWSLANEYETHPDGRYRLDRPDDVEWAKATACYVKQLDPYRHLVTAHSVVSASTRGASPRDPFEPPWRIGPFFGADDANESHRIAKVFGPYQSK